jgi:hypothetical protein
MISSKLSHQVISDRNSSEAKTRLSLEVEHSVIDPVHFKRYHSIPSREEPRLNRCEYGTSANPELFTLVEPTPIGPPQNVKLVDEVAVCEIILQCDDSFVDTLAMLLLSKKRNTGTDDQDDSFFHQERKKQKRNSDSSTSLAPLMFEINASFQEGLKLVKVDQWYERYQELCRFNQKHGHCLVPHNFEGNPALAQWVKRHRHQYKLKKHGRHSTLTDKREAALEKLNFVWDSHGAIWDERFNDLLVFKSLHRHVNVPSTFPEDPQLSIWVKCQRRQYKLFQTGQKSNIKQGRVAKLEKVGFVFNPRNLKF